MKFFNPLNDQMCSNCQKARKIPLGPKVPSISTKLSTRILLLLLFILISPLFAFIVLPYVWVKNIMNHPQKQKRSKNWSRIIWATFGCIGLILITPITWALSIIWIFWLFCKFSSKKKHSKVHVKKPQEETTF